jgi:nucleotide-binding universal stress UspA family protein
MPETLQLNGRARLRPTTDPPMRRVLVVANQSATSPRLIAELKDRSAHGPVDLHLVVPALNSRLSHWLSATDGAVSNAHRRADDAKAVLMAHGLDVSVEIGDSVPVLAIDDALADFDADEIVISTLPRSQSHWLERNVVELACDRFGVPVQHVVESDDGSPKP